MKRNGRKGVGSGSGGGAQSAILGASGNSSLYDDYLTAIGAVSDYKDDICGSMCWCPITNLDQGDEAYEWNMGLTRSSLSTAESNISLGLVKGNVKCAVGLGVLHTTP